MSKRRLSTSDAEDEKAPEDLTPEERRERRRRERAQEKSGKRRRGLGTPLQRGLALAAVAAVIVVVVILLATNFFHLPSACLTLSEAPTSPYYPPSTTTDFSGTWCPPADVSTAYVVQPMLKIVINGTSVNLPDGIGVNKSYANGAVCDLPITTPTTSGELPTDVFTISSAWQYSYNLSWFFQDWQATFPTVTVGSSPNQPVTYTATDLLGFTVNARHAIHLFVDNQLSSAGPSLDLSTLPYESQTFPSCIASQYGTGHTVLLTYTTIGATSVAPTGPAAPSETAPPSVGGAAPSALVGTTLPFLYGNAAAGIVGALAFVEMRGAER